MRRPQLAVPTPLLLLAAMCALLGLAWPSLAAPIIIDHNCIDASRIPSEWITAAKERLRLHYGHTSHGSQLITGLERHEAQDATFDVEISSSGLPSRPGALCIYHVSNNPSQYYAQTQGILDRYDAINVSMFGWCCQANEADWEDILETYLENMQAFEAANPDVTFIYMTGNAQATGLAGYNRFRFNQRLRSFCQDNDKVLFDFADLDCWYNGEQHTYQYEGITVPSEHPQFHGSQAGHTTYQSCEQKGRAVWWMMARLAGWKPGGQPPVPDIKANGSDDYLILGAGETVALTLGLDPGDAAEAVDWWVCALTPWQIYSFVYPQGWLPNLYRTIVLAPLPFADYEVLNSPLAPGEYTFYFALDDNADGSPDGTFLDQVTVSAQ